MSEELDNAISSLLPEEVSTPTAVESVENKEEVKVEEGQPEPKTQVTDNSQKPVVKPSRRETEKKNFDEYRSFSDRKINELTKKLTDYEAKQKQYAPLEQFLPDLQKVLEEKRKAEQAQQYQQNPLQAQQQLMEQMLNERLAPFQQQQAQVQIEQTVSQNIDFLKQTYGEEAFKEVSPYMGAILENTKEQFGQEIADVLARAPQHLFNAAFGELALQKIADFNKDKQVGTQNKVILAQQSAGISKPNKTSRSQGPQSSNSIEQAAFDFLKQNS